MRENHWVFSSGVVHEGIKEYHRKKVNDAFNNGVFVGRESVRDAVAKVLGFTTGKE